MREGVVAVDGRDGMLRASFRPCCGTSAQAVCPAHTAAATCGRDRTSPSARYRCLLAGARLYTAVVLAHGAAEDRVLGVKGETEMVGMHGGKHFVDWYNGHPDAAGADFALRGATTAVVVG